MIIIDDKAQIVPGNIIYNPAENVRYKVTDLVFDNELKTPFVLLLPLPPFGTVKMEFRISIGSIIALGYLLEGESYHLL
jgi:hypothetical protein